MKAYTWVEWKEKFKSEAKDNKQKHHDLDCTALVTLEEAQKEIQKLEKLIVEYNKQAVEYEAKMEGKIVEANKILDEKIKVFETAKADADTVYETSASYVCASIIRVFSDLKDALQIPRKENPNGIGVSERAQTRTSLNCRNDETPITKNPWPAIKEATLPDLKKAIEDYKKEKVKP